MNVPEMIVIPKGARPHECRFCPEVFYWSKHPSTGKPVPVSCDLDGAQEPTREADGLGVNHFITCPGRDQARKPRND